MSTPIEFKNCVMHVQPPGVERLLKAAAESTISFAGALPAGELFPNAELGSAFQRALDRNGQDALQYNWSEGYAPLRDQIASYMRGLGVGASAEEILITHGAQQALDLLAKLTLREGDPLALEAPTYSAAIQAFELQKPRLVQINRTAANYDASALTTAIDREHCKLIYVIPT